MDNFNARVDRAFKDGENKENHYRDAFLYMQGKSVSNMRSIEVKDTKNRSHNNDEMTRD